ncbi:aldehyde dehydrogenase (NAD+) [Penicillium daleae]|uniref:aldehyde dehydrogenase (NAD(+)) n=1 Tax=Penicillium daleae TaxID=63821 RepID=A0AAD6CAP6_9EURO|nr:aldehyde dehydrogenase (NAD+) [Penicillium daleae]KAJ5454895.1 aldehyde dehydrogenase (NAD+) [Penicillium daleae]
MSDLTLNLTAPNGLNYMQPIGLFINNEFVKSASRVKLSTIDPATEAEIASVYAASTDDVDVAVKAARKAFNEPSWAGISSTDRGNLLLKLASLVEENAHHLATIESWDNGKPYIHALNVDIPAVANTFRYYGGWADKIQGDVIETSPQKLTYTIREPVGVCGQIIPWNFPLAMAAWKLGPALACGNTSVLKPAEQTPLSILYLATLIKEAGFPPGVVNILNGHGRTTGDAIATHVDVDKVAFTGSTATGRQIMRSAALNLKNITLETGGKSPLLVFNDADLKSAVAWAHTGIMFNQGQVCTANSRILIQEGIYDRFLVAFKEQVKKVSKIGNPFDDATFQGPQVTQAQFDRIVSYIDSGIAEGACLAYGGKPYKNVNGKGFFIEPTIFTNVKDEMKICQEEVFGPFVVISPFKTEEEAVRRANDTPFGLASSVFTQDIKKAHRVARAIQAGMVWINSSGDSDFRIPFGGVKQSGMGRELGEAGLAAYTNLKAVHVNLS